MTKAIYPGSFDPLTNGHLDIIKRASKVFDTIYVCVADNPVKKYYFTKEERVAMAKVACVDIPNVVVTYTDGIVVKKAKELDCKVIVRGLRAVTDFEFELQLATANEYIDKDIDTMFLMASSGKSFISSSFVKDFYFNNVDISNLVPPVVLEYFKRKQ